MRNATLNKKNRMLLWSVLTLVAGLPAGRVTAAVSIPITACQTVISASGNYFLDSDLNCNGAPFGIAIVEKNVDLDLKGHVLFNNFVGTGIGTGVPPFSTSSCVAATGVHIHGGVVANFNVGIALCTPDGASVSLNALVERMYVAANATGISIYGSNTNSRVETGNISKNLTGVHLGPSTSGNDIGGLLFNANAEG